MHTGVVALSSKNRYHRPTATQDVHRYISSHIDYLNDTLPHPNDGSFTSFDAGFDNGAIQRLQSNSIIEKTHKENGIWHYQTKPAAWDVLQELLETRSPTWETCGHGGIVNIRGGGYACGYDACTLEYTKGEAMEEYWDS